LSAAPEAMLAAQLVRSQTKINPVKMPMYGTGALFTTFANDSSSFCSSWFISELTGSPVNLLLLAAIVYLLYKILKPDGERARMSEKSDVFPSVDELPGPPPPPPLPPLKKQDFTLQQLRAYDGTGEDGRVLVAVCGKVFDVTKGKRFYGPGGPYAGFAGRDASRGLATFSVEPVSDDWDDLSDLKPSEMDQVKEWELQFSEKYALVGKLLKPGEEPTHYSEEEEEDEEEEEGQKKSN